MPEIFEKILATIDKYGENNSRTLEEYLRALWRLAQAHQDKPELPEEMVLELFEQAWTAELVPFDPEWIALKEDYSGLVGFEAFRRTICIQIADLKQMRDLGYYERNPRDLYFGLKSPTGTWWYNWSIEGYLEAFCRHAEDARYEHNNTSWSWEEVSDLLFTGVIYE